MKSRKWYYLLIVFATVLHTDCEKNTPDLITGNVVDFEGNTYRTVRIGPARGEGQFWMAENLKSTKYNDGTDITGFIEYWCCPEIDISTYVSIYGHLYREECVLTGKLCPVGWHVPSTLEWQKLIDYLGGNTAAAPKLKEVGTAHWTTNNDATNESGFTALPGGGFAYRLDFGAVTGGLGLWGKWWSQSEKVIPVEFYSLDSSKISLDHNTSRITWALSVRCIKGAVKPSVKLTFVEDVTSSSALCNAEITSDGGEPVTARGFCWSTSPDFSDEECKTFSDFASADYSGTISNLNENTRYYLRAFATNSKGTSYSYNVLSFKTYDSEGTSVDVDGNVYQGTHIGDQIWMAENLKTTKYNDGTPIQLIDDNIAWQNDISGAYCLYNIKKEDAYGAFYNWYAVNTGKLCPAGWHIPSGSDWSDLLAFVGSNAGSKLKSEFTWSTYATYAPYQIHSMAGSNETNFTGLAGGTRDGSGGGSIGSSANFWSSTEFGSDKAYALTLSFSYGSYTSTANISSNWSKSSGLSVRCIKDN